MNRDGEIIAGSGALSVAQADISLGQPAGDVQSQRIINRRIMQYSCFYHAGGTAVSFFGRLECKADSAAQAVPVSLEDTRDAEKVGCVAIVTTGVHHTGRLGGIGTGILLCQGQGVHVGTKQQDRTGQCPADEPCDACISNDAGIFYACFLEFTKDRLARFAFLTAQFGMSMEMFTHVDHIR